MIRLASLALLLSLSGCAHSGYRMGNFGEDPAYAPPRPEPPPIVDSDGGIRVNRGSLYSGRRALEIGDLLTISISHSTSADSSATTDLKRGSEVSAGVEALLGLEGAMVKAGLNPAALIKGSTTNNFNGAGGTGRSGALKATITARVVDVEPNGVLVIGARQAVKINNEVQILTVRGRVDSRAIGADNVVSGSQIADARIEYTGVGVVAGKQRPGWLARILDVVTPF